MEEKNNVKTVSENLGNKVLQHSGRLLTRNTLYNLMGQVFPLLSALVTIPIIVRGLGTDRFGILTLSWIVVGYFTLFDMGIGRATTKFVAEHLALRQFAALPRLIWTSVIMLLSLGAVGGLIIAVSTPLIVTRALTIPRHLVEETRQAFYLLAVSIPFVIGTSGLRGALEAQQRFALVNAIKIPAGITTFLAPALVLPFSNRLHHIVAVLVVSRFFFFVIFFFFCMNSLPGLTKPQSPSIQTIKDMLKFGGWLTVSNIIGPFMSYMDRFFVGMLLSMSAVAYYATPYDLVTKLWIISGSILGVLFPVFSSYAVTDKAKFSSVFDRTVKYLLIILVPIVILIIVMSEPFLDIWLGREFADNSAPVMQLLTIGTLICALAQVPFSSIQALGRPDLTAKLHFAELPVYLVLMWFLIPILGIIGAAIAWFLRIVIDTVMLFILYHAVMPATYNRRKIRLVLSMIGIFGILILIGYASHLLRGTGFKILLLALCIVSFVVYAYKFLFDPTEQEHKSFLNSLQGSK